MFAQLFILTISAYVVFGDTNKVPPYVKQCKESDPQLLDCLIGALQHLSPYLATGIKEIELPTVEPFQMDELTLSLTTGPNGYKVSLLDIDIFGASNYTVKKIKLSENGKPFQAIINIPELRINAKYRSTGVLIILPASGNGTFHAKFKNVTAVVQGQISVNYKGDLKYLHVDTLNLDLDVKDAQMGVKKIYRNNRILIEAINLFFTRKWTRSVKSNDASIKEKVINSFPNYRKSTFDAYTDANVFNFWFVFLICTF